jgi:hypothetical protein
MNIAKTLPVDMPLPILLTDVVGTLGNDAASTLRTMSTLSPSTLSPSLRSDLMRFADEACDTDLLPVLAAIVRHAKSLSLHLHLRDRIIVLSVFPREQQFYCNFDVCALRADEMSRLRLVHVGPVLATESRGLADVGVPHVRVLATLLWQLALHGPREELLPEIAGPARYRLAPGVPLRSLPMDAWILPIMQRLRGEASTLQELAPRTAAEQARARRLLNAIYLQGRLMITRSLPMQRQASIVPRSARSAARPHRPSAELKPARAMSSSAAQLSEVK